jgi:transcription elongation factor Elf1
MQTDKYASVSEKPKKKIFFCWNTKAHPTYSEYMWEGEYNRIDTMKCPICGQSHKVTVRMGD